MKTSVHGAIVDAEKIGKGLYEMIVEADQHHIVAFGMIPIEFIRSLEKMLAEKYETIGREEAKKLYGMNIDPVLDVTDSEKKKKFVQQTVLLVTIEIFKAANAAGRMVV